MSDGDAKIVHRTPGFNRKPGSHSRRLEAILINNSKTNKFGDILFDVPPNYQTQTIPTSGRSNVLSVNPAPYTSTLPIPQFPAAENIGSCSGESGGVYAGTVG